MSAHERLAHEANALARGGDHAAAVDRARGALLLILNGGESEGRFSLDFRPLAGMKVESRSQLEITCRDNAVHLLCACELVDGWFTNWLDAFAVIRTLFAAMASDELPDGACIFDIEDGSSQGDYFRIAFGATNDNALLVVDSYWVKYRGYAALREQIAATARPWQERADTVFWRGGTTGLRSFTPPGMPVTDWSWLQRLHLCDVARRSRFRDRLDVGVVHFAQVPEAHLVEEIKRAGFVRERCDKLRFLDHRYIIDIDGNANAWDGLFGAMLMGACILKVESRVGWREWYYDRLRPFEHYIPVNADLSDLDEKMDWINLNFGACSMIAENAYVFAWEMEYQNEISISSKFICESLRRDG